MSLRIFKHLKINHSLFFTVGSEEDRTCLIDSLGNSNSSDTVELLTPQQRHQVKHRELFLSRQIEILPASSIKGKCSVTLLNETESLKSYLSKDVSRKFHLLEERVVQRH